jgi:hypothetical protein
MNKYLVLACFSAHNMDDDELWSNQWLVGTFESLEECYTKCENDLEQVGKDSLEGRYDDEEEFEEEVKFYLSGKEISHRTEDDFIGNNPVTILSNDYWTDEHREMINYIVVKIG